jgi:hypothetical protein
MDDCNYCGEPFDLDVEGFHHHEECVDGSGCQICSDPIVKEFMSNKFVCSPECECNLLREEGIIPNCD